MIIIGIDWGRQRIGIAASDALGLMAHPVITLDGFSNKEAIEKIAQLYVELKAEKVVMGLPKNMDGTEGKSASDARHLAKKIGERLNVSIILWDERLTSWEADAFLIKETKMSSRKRKKVRDQMAACLILQGYLDSLKKHSNL